MSIIINELSIEVSGNVVKNSTPGGNSVLRMTEEQAHEIFLDLAAHFAPGPAASVDHVTGTEPKHEKLGSQEDFKNAVDEVAK